MKNLGTYIVITFIVVACGQTNNKYPDLFNRLEVLVEKQPAAVLDSLKTIHPDKLNEADQAHYYLLEAIASDKNYTSQNSDSTLKISEKYYRKVTDFYNLSKTQLYLGEHLFLKNENIGTAFYLLKEAVNNFDKSKSNDLHIKGLIYYWLAQLHHKQGNYIETERYYQHSIGIFKETSDSISSFYSQKELGWLYMNNKNYIKAEKILSSISIMSPSDNDNIKSIVILNASLLNAQSYLYRNTNNYSKALEIGLKSIHTLKEHKIGVPNAYFYNIIVIYKNINQLDTARAYCNRLIETAKKEKDQIGLTNAYRQLFQLEEEQGNFQKSCLLRDEYNKLKDSLSSQNQKENLAELEKKYDLEAKEKIIIQGKYRFLLLCFIIFLMLTLSTSVYLCLASKHKKLKNSNEFLAEAVKKTQWGHVLFKTLISDNHDTFENIEGVLAKNVSEIPNHTFKEFEECLRSQKMAYSLRLRNSLGSVDSEFIDELNTKFPDLTAEDLLIASMLRHEWNLNDIAGVLRITLEALKKRMRRIKLKVMKNSKSKDSLGEFLRKM